MYAIGRDASRLASIIRTLRIDERPTRLAQAVAELGRNDKTIHSLTYIDDESCVIETILGFEEGEDVDCADAAAIPAPKRAILGDLGATTAHTCA
jgi:TnpA family transposase